MEHLHIDDFSLTIAMTIGSGTCNQTCCPAEACKILSLACQVALYGCHAIIAQLACSIFAIKDGA